MKHILLKAKAEIETLRRTNEILRAKVEVMDLFACVLHTSPATYNPAQSLDVAWMLQREVNRLEIEEIKKNPPPGMNHFCNGTWSCRSTDVHSVCGYCGEENSVQETRPPAFPENERG